MATLYEGTFRVSDRVHAIVEDVLPQLGDNDIIRIGTELDDESTGEWVPFDVIIITETIITGLLDGSHRPIPKSFLAAAWMALWERLIHVQPKADREQCSIGLLLESSIIEADINLSPYTTASQILDSLHTDVEVESINVIRLSSSLHARHHILNNSAKTQIPQAYSKSPISEDAQDDHLVDEIQTNITLPPSENESSEIPQVHFQEDDIVIEALPHEQPQVMYPHITPPPPSPDSLSHGGGERTQAPTEAQASSIPTHIQTQRVNNTTQTHYGSQTPQDTSSKDKFDQANDDNVSPLEKGVSYTAQVVAPIRKWATRVATYFKPPVSSERIRQTLRQEFLNKKNAQDGLGIYVLPNHWLIEVNDSVFQTRFAASQNILIERLGKQLLSVLETNNQRLGSAVYQLAAPLMIEIRPNPQVETKELRIIPSFTNISPTLKQPQPRLQWLIHGKSSREWKLTDEVIRIGRNKTCQIHLDAPNIAAEGWVSRRHARIERQDDQYVLYDGATAGVGSTNGTFVGQQRLFADTGVILHDGDIIHLGSKDESAPTPDVDGVVTLKFVVE